MVYFILAYRVLLLLCTTLISPISSTSFNGNVSDGGAIVSFLNELIQPYLQSNVSINNKPKLPYLQSNVSITNKPKLRSKKDKILADVENRIKLKVKELKPMLQDNKYNDKIIETENNIKLEGKDDTTIIEFAPKSYRKFKVKSALNETDTFQNKIDKYKQLRKNITKLLDKEKTARSTKKLIRRTLDDMLAQLIERQCTWKSMDTENLKNHLFGARANARKTMSKLKTLSNKDWMSLRKKYEKFLEYNAGKQSEFMSAFQDYFSSFFNDTSNLAKKYKIRCQIVESDDVDDKTYLRTGRNDCGNFKICSEELTNFLNVTYHHLNDTVVSIFANYAAMYIRDVQEVTFISGNDVVASLLRRLGNFAEKAVNKLFIAKLDKFSLDKNKNKEENIEVIKNFITDTIVAIKNSLLKLMESELRVTKNQLFSTMEADLTVNLKMDMDNLKQSILDSICKLFVLCNGRIAGTRKSGRREMPRDTENLYVKVQVTFDDELKKSLARYSQRKDWPGDLTRRLVKSLAALTPTKTTFRSNDTTKQGYYNNENKLINTFF